MYYPGVASRWPSPKVALVRRTQGGRAGRFHARNGETTKTREERECSEAQQPHGQTLREKNAPFAGDARASVREKNARGANRIPARRGRCPRRRAASTRRGGFSGWSARIAEIRTWSWIMRATSSSAYDLGWGPREEARSRYGATSLVQKVESRRGAWKSSRVFPGWTWWTTDRGQDVDFGGTASGKKAAVAVASLGVLALHMCTRGRPQLLRQHQALGFILQTFARTV